jgi:hypothetical protein
MQFSKMRFLGVALLLLSPLMFGGAPDSYAGAEIPPGTRRVGPPPRLVGDVTVMYDAANNQVAASIFGLCRGHRFTMGPFFFSLMDTFDQFLDDVEGIFIPSVDHPELFSIPPSCFREETANLQGFEVSEVIILRRHNANLASGRIELLGVVPE